MAPKITDTMITDFIVDAACQFAIRSTYHTVLKSTPGAAIFGRDMLFDIPYIANWNDIGRRRQEKVNKDNQRENLTHLPFDYVVGGKIHMRKDGILRKAIIKYEGPYTIT